MNRRTRMMMAGLLAGALVLLPNAAMAAVDLIDANPARVSLEVPAPGKSVEWNMSARNLTDEKRSLTLSIEGSSERLFDGPYPLELELVEPRSGKTLYAGPASGAFGGAVTVPDLPSDGFYELRGSVYLPAEADNRYQGASGRMVFEFRTIEEEVAVPQPGPGGLAETGSVLLILAVLAGAGAVAGLGGVLHGRKRT